MTTVGTVSFTYRGEPILVAVDLPNPKVDVISTESDGKHTIDIKISRGNVERTYEGGKSGGYSRDGAVREAVERILKDPAADEFRPAQPKRPGV